MSTPQKITLSLSETIAEFRTKFQYLSDNVGDLSLLQTSIDSADDGGEGLGGLVGAINELDSDLHGPGGGSAKLDLTTTAKAIVDAINELDSDLHGVGGGTAFSELTTAAKNVVDAINEHDAELGTISSAAMGTTASTVSTAIKELDSDLHGALGGSAWNDLTTNAGTIVGAINEHDAELGLITSPAMGTSASTVSTAIAELHDSLGDALLTTTATKAKEAINEHDAELGTITSVAMGTVASTVSGAITELHDSLGDALLTTSAKQVKEAINEHDAELGIISSGAMGTVASTVSGAIAELHDSLGDALLTTTASQVKEAINEHEADIGNMVFTGLSATDISAALRELRTELGNVNDINNATGYSSTTATTGITEIQGKVGEVTSVNMGTSASTVVTAIDELHDSLGDALLTTTAKQAKEAINELHGEHGTLSSLTTTAKNTFVNAINELDAELGTISAVGFNNDGPADRTGATTVQAAINALDAAVGRFDSNGSFDPYIANNSSADDLLEGINFLSAQVSVLDASDSANTAVLGSISNLDAPLDGAANIIDAINDLNDVNSNINHVSNNILRYNGTRMVPTGSTFLVTSGGATTIAGNTTITGTSTFTVAGGLASLDGGIDVDGAFTVANTTGNINTTGTLTVGSTTTLNGNTVIGSDANDTVEVKADVSSNLIPNVTNRDLGSNTFKWNLFANAIDTQSLQVDTNATVNGNLTVNGNTTLGDSASNTVTFTADVASSLLPSADNTYDLGGTGAEWRNLYIDGTAKIDTLTVDASATITSNLTVNGNTTLGNDQDNDTVTFTADVASSLLPSADNTYDLGAVGSEWRNLYIDGTASIDILAVDNVSSNLIPNLLGQDLGSNTLKWDLWANAIDTQSLQVDTNATVSGNLTVNGNTTLGNAATDTVTVNATSIFNNGITVKNSNGTDNRFSAYSTEVKITGDRSNNKLQFVNTYDGGWTVGDNFGLIEFYSNDTDPTSPGVGARALIVAQTTDVSGVGAEIAFSVSQTGSLASESFFPVKVTKDGIVGNVTGDVTGDVTGNVTGNVAGVADNADTVFVTADNTGDTVMPVLLSAAGGNAYRSVFEDDNLYFDNTNDILYTPNISVTGYIDWKDGDIARFGSSDDLEIFHSGGINYFDCNNSSTLKIRSTTTDKFTFDVPNGNLTATGTISAETFNSTSDVRHKENIVTIENALDKVNAIRGVSFDMDNKKQIGVVAQEVLEIVPEVVDTSNEDKYTVSYGNLVGLLIEAVKELSDKIDRLEN